MTKAKAKPIASDPNKCDGEVYRQGEAIVMVAMPSKSVEQWVNAIRKRSRQRVDWHYVGGRAVVKFIGDRAKVAEAIRAEDPLYQDLMKASMRRFAFYREDDPVQPVYWFGEE